MVDEELIDLINKIKDYKAEFQTIEVKAAQGGCPKRLYDTLSSFSNQDEGGILVFGLDERNDFEAVGVFDVQELQKKVNEQCKQMSPIVRPVFTTTKYQGKNIVSAEIPSVALSERPCFYTGIGRIKGSYIRSGDSDEPMSEYEVYSYEAYRKKYQDDIRINEKASMIAIDNKKIESYVEKIKNNNFNLSKLKEREIYELLNLTVGGKLTLVSILLFSHYPQIYYPQYTINAIVVPGYELGDVDEEGVRFIDNKRIEGTLIDMIDDTLRFVNKNMSIKTIFDTETGARKDKTEYPILAIREAVLNAVIHRDYSIHTEGMPIELIMYKNRIEIRNPGGLYGRVTVDKLGKIQPDTRNPALARAMETLGKTENRYSGIPTIRRLMREEKLPEPVFVDSRNEFCITLYNENTEKKSTDKDSVDVDLIEFCKTPRTRQEIADYLKIKTVAHVMNNYINPLIQEGKLKMEIPDKPRSSKQKYYI